MFVCLFMEATEALLRVILADENAISLTNVLLPYGIATQIGLFVFVSHSQGVEGTVVITSKLKQCQYSLRAPI